MSCNSYDACVNRERGNMRYPVDSESLYANRSSDDQMANTRCYRTNPVEILEGFGCKLSWEKVLKLTVVVLLVVLFAMLAKDFFMTRQLPSVGVSEVSPLQLSTIATK